MKNADNKEKVVPEKIFTAIPAIMQAVGAIAKDKKNTGQGYNFRGIDDIYNALHKHLAEHKVFVTKEILSHNREERESKKGAATLYSIIEIRFTYHAEDGSSIQDTAVGEAMDFGDKASNKAMSAAFKYSLMQVFCIPTIEEKDTELQDHQVKPKAQQQPQQVSELATDKQKELILKLSNSHVFKNDQTVKLVLEKINNNELTKAKAIKAIDWMEKELKDRKEIEKMEQEVQHG